MDIQFCQQCGLDFTPRREHARFCSVRCRSAWNRERFDDPAAEVAALRWSITAMSEAVGLLPRAPAWDRTSAFAGIGEAVWWVTIVDGRLNRHHAGPYDAVLADQPRAERLLIEESLAGLRFVRNQIGRDVEIAEFVEPGSPGRGVGAVGIVDWTWRAVSAPANLGSLSRRARGWEMARYRAYQDQLAGHPIGEVFQRAVVFLNRTAENAIPDISAHAAR
jgi:hypothetical protein